MDWAIDSPATRLADLPPAYRAYFAAASLTHALGLCPDTISTVYATRGVAVGERIGYILGHIRPLLNPEAPPAPDTGRVHAQALYARRDEGAFAGESDFIECALKVWDGFLEPEPSASARLLVRAAFEAYGALMHWFMFVPEYPGRLGPTAVLQQARQDHPVFAGLLGYQRDLLTHVEAAARQPRDPAERGTPGSAVPPLSER
jgi:hypothetical protein